MKTALLLLAFLLTWSASAWGTELLVDRAEPHYSEHDIEVRQWVYLSDGLKVKGLLFTPKASKQRKMPAVVFCHDGIGGVSKSHRRSCVRLARSGFVVFAPSYRGEDGSDGLIEIAKGEVRDVLRAIDLLESRPEVDSSKIAVAGASHGALISALAAAHDPRIKAAVLAYGVMDIYRWWEHLQATHQVGHDEITRRTYGDGPEDHPESFRIRNAVDSASKINCPVLILQGGKDTIVPPEQANFMKAALEAQKKSCQVEIYPDCLHGFLVYVPYMTHDVDPKERAQTEMSWRVFTEFLHKNL